jgi:hypothetical protein
MSTTDLPGSSLLAGRYRLVERLGAGGMSVVWRGFDEVLGRQVAVKVLPPSTSTDPSFRRRLRAEAQAAARLSHPHITNVYDYGEATTVDGEPVPYVVMELVDGESLAAVLARSRRLPWPAAVRISSEVSAALAAAHARGIVHRDVTPANVMLTSAGAKVVDFGISALIGENDIDPDGSLLGTPAYLAPERLEGGQVSPATDVYAVGLLIYRTLIGQLPWDVGTTTALLRAHQYTEPEPLPHVEGLPPAVEALIARCLEKRPDDRPSSAEVAHVLGTIAAGNPSSRGFVPDWADSSEDTTILPSAMQYTDTLHRPKHGQAQVGAPQQGRGVAAVNGAAVASRVVEAPVSPAPGAARPVPLADVEAAVAGLPVADRQAAPAARVAPDTATPPGSRTPAKNGGRNSRFAGDSSRSSDGPHASVAVAAAPARPVSSGPAGSGPASSGPALRPAAGNARPGNGADRPAGPPNQPPGPPNGPGRGSGGNRPANNQSRRILLVAGFVVLLGAGTYAWSLAAGKSHDSLSAAEPTVVATSGKCVVSYSVWKDDGKEFTASVSVANRDSSPVKDWQLYFQLPGDQTVLGDSTVKLDQQGGGVTVKSTDTLRPQGTATLQVSGRYKQSNAAPMVFQLGGQTCTTYVSPKPGAPSQPVEHLSNGATRLGPVPTTSTPVPGLSTKPNGVVIPVPVPVTSTSTIPVPVTSSTSTKPVVLGGEEVPSSSSTPSSSKSPANPNPGDGGDSPGPSESVSTTPTDTPPANVPVLGAE